MKLKDSLREYVQSGIYPFHMPGHKRNPEYLPDGDMFSLDLTELDETDDINAPGGILLSAMRRAAKLYSVKKTFFSVGGSTLGILSAVHAMASYGDKVLVARNCHRSVYNAVCMNHLDPVYVFPNQDSRFGICTEISPDSVKKSFEHYPDIKLVIITSPTYEGVISDIAEISGIVHRHGALLLVDEAHGAHLGFHKAFPKSASALGADVVVQSLHKTLPCLTQTALVHICTDRVSENALKTALGMYGTSSPSYLLMCSIDNCVSLISEKGERLFSDYAQRLNKFYGFCESLKNLSVLGCAEFGNSVAFGRDPSKVLISSRGTNLSGRELYYILKNRYKLQLEMYTCDCVLAVTSVCDTDEGFEKLAAAIGKIDESIMPAEVNGKISLNAPPEKVLLPYAALETDKTTVALEDSQGKISAGFVYCYPPGIPVLVPGERISAFSVMSLSRSISAGISVYGSGLAENGEINVVKTKNFF